MFRPALALLSLAIFPETLSACIPPPPAVRLPGESDAAYQLRAQIFTFVREDEDRRRHQVHLYDKASRISLATVTKSQAIDASGLPGNEIEAQIIASLRGQLEPSVITLADRHMTSCGPSGGGPATGSPPGTYIVVFEGELFGTGETDSFGIALTQLREPRVLKEIDEAIIRLGERAKTP